MTCIMAAVMPILLVVMENARRKEHFGLFEFLKGFWQLLLAEFCHEWLPYMLTRKSLRHVVYQRAVVMQLCTFRKRWSSALLVYSTSISLCGYMTYCCMRTTSTSTSTSSPSYFRCRTTSV
ncbi:hypothetical protein PHMEG_00011382 [Phytophthora megakarya]|uniref:Uncharacterized protein n=1 Tax=Phytophthora megakarya TaxID=4795 RepID=A0A225WDE1_9STRA|nr:hypothetical protein PHMEG_00011382 [Phytophthora megakarya]